MSNAEVERFVADLKSNDGLRSELSGHASGVGSVVAFAKDKGYDMTADGAGAYISAQAGRELSDERLDSLAGGKADGGPPTVSEAYVEASISVGGQVETQVAVVVT